MNGENMSIKALCITSHSDRPEAETQVGLQKKGVEIDIIAHPGGFNNLIYEDSGVPLTTHTIKSRFDLAAIKLIRNKLAAGNYDILHVFNNKALSNALIAAIGFPVKIVAYRGIVGNVSFFDPASWMTWLNPRINKIICVAEAIRQHFLQMHFLGVKMNPQRFVTIHKGHKLSWYQNPCFCRRLHCQHPATQRHSCPDRGGQLHP